MTYEEERKVLMQALRFAAGRGFNGAWAGQVWDVHQGPIEGRMVLCLPHLHPEGKLHISIADVIFTHDFAQKFFGTGWLDIVTGRPRQEHDIFYGRATHLPAWEWHLQQMVVSKDPAIYIRDFMEAQS